MPSSPAERDEYVEYFSGSGAITCRVLYRTEQLIFVQFRTVDWPGYRDFSSYARVALFPNTCGRRIRSRRVSWVSLRHWLERSPPSSSSPNVDITGPHPGLGPERGTPVMAVYLRALCAA